MRKLGHPLCLFWCAVLFMSSVAVTHAVVPAVAYVVEAGAAAVGRFVIQNAARQVVAGRTLAAANEAWYGAGAAEAMSWGAGLAAVGVTGSSAFLLLEGVSDGGEGAPEEAVGVRIPILDEDPQYDYDDSEPWLLERRLENQGPPSGDGWTVTVPSNITTQLGAPGYVVEASVASCTVFLASVTASYSRCGTTYTAAKEPEFFVPDPIWTPLIGVSHVPGVPSVANVATLPGGYQIHLPRLGCGAVLTVSHPGGTCAAPSGTTTKTLTWGLSSDSHYRAYRVPNGVFDYVYDPENAVFYPDMTDGDWGRDWPSGISLMGVTDIIVRGTDPEGNDWQQFARATDRGVVYDSGYEFDDEGQPVVEEEGAFFDLYQDGAAVQAVHRQHAGQTLSSFINEYASDRAGSPQLNLDGLLQESPPPEDPDLQVADISEQMLGADGVLGEGSPLQTLDLWEMPDVAAQCPVVEFPFFQQTISSDVHCQLWAQHGETLSNIWLIVWSVLALMLVLGA